MTTGEATKEKAKLSKKTEAQKTTKKTTTKTTKKTAARKKAAPRKSVTKSAENIISTELREQMIRDAAYFRAESRGFIGGSPEQDWLEAEVEVNAKIKEMAV